MNIITKLTLAQLSVFQAWVIVRLTLRYATPDIHCRDRRYESDGGIKRTSVSAHSTHRSRTLYLQRPIRSNVRPWFSCRVPLQSSRPSRCCEFAPCSRRRRRTQTKQKADPTITHTHTHTHARTQRSTQPCIPPESLNRVPASAGGKGGILTSVGRQVALCDPIWHVSFP